MNTNWSRWWPVLLVIWGVAAPPAIGQQLPATLVNGGLEQVEVADQFSGWFFASQSGGVLIVDAEETFAGDRSAQLDATQSNSSAASPFSNLMQTIDGAPWRGKKVRFRAAVRTADLIGDARAQLWFRVDRPSPDEQLNVGAFDNMDPRPIRQSDWQHYEIVLRVDDDAVQIVVGMFIQGLGRAWIDDASLEEVPADTPTTEMNLASTDDDENAASRRRNFPPVLAKAFAEAENAPQQPFFNHWLWLAGMAILLMALSGLPAKTIEVKAEESVRHRPNMGLVPKFSLRFTTAYWLLYSFPEPFTSLIPVYGAQLNSWYNARMRELIGWVGSKVLNIPHELVPPNGSGDTTFSYIQALLTLAVALAVAIVWSLADRRRTDHRTLKDLLRIYLRYVLAMTMLGYGLAKVAWDMNQFPPLGTSQLETTWGDSSPMSVVWRMMGASLAYTIFAGLGEVVGALLLLFRRTTTLGALVVFGVMTNVMMLNYCYDIPVKLYSTHLVAMAVYLLLPEVDRLLRFFVFNQPAPASELRPPNTGPVSIWFLRAAKVAVLVMGFGLPIYLQVARHVDYFARRGAQADLLGYYEVESFQQDGEDADPAAWSAVRFDLLGYSIPFEIKPTLWMYVVTPEGQEQSVCFELEDGSQLKFNPHFYASIPSTSMLLIALPEGRWQLLGETAAGKIEVVLKPAVDRRYLLTSRGFRWINEVPFNR